MDNDKYLNKKFRHDESYKSNFLPSIHNEVVWEKRTPVSTVLNSPDLSSDMELKLRYYGHDHLNQIKVGCSPDHTEATINDGSPLQQQFEADSNPLNYPILSNGESIVFDDIEDNNWSGNRILISPIEDKSFPYLEQRETRPQSSNVQSSDNKVLQVLGGLQIAEYEGSPRRIGNAYQQQEQQYNDSFKTNSSSPLSLPRPGFPLRVLSPASENQLTNLDNAVAPNSAGNFLPSPSSSSLLTNTTNTNDNQSFRLENHQNSLNYESIDHEYYFNYYNNTTHHHHHHQMNPLEQLQYDNNKSYVDHKLGSSMRGQQQEDHFQYDMDLDMEQAMKTRNFTLSPETTDYDSSNCDLDSELSLKYVGAGTEYVTDSTGRLHSNSMPILEDGLSSGHASDTESNNASLSILIEQCRLKDINNTTSQFISTIQNSMQRNDQQYNNDSISNTQSNSPPPPAPPSYRTSAPNYEQDSNTDDDVFEPQTSVEMNQSIALERNDRDKEKPEDNLDSLSEQTAKEKLMPCCDEEEADTDLETDRLLGQQRLEENSVIENKTRKARTLRSAATAQALPLQINKSHSAIRHHPGGGHNNNNNTCGGGVTTTTTISSANDGNDVTTMVLPPAETSNSQIEIQQIQKSPTGSVLSKKGNDVKKNRSKEGLLDPTVLIEGVLFRAKYLGSTQLVCEGQPTKMTRMMQAEEAVSRIKAPEGESQPSTDVDLFISTEKIMVLNTDLKEIMMDHALRTISYIADIGELVVLMARRRFIQQESPETSDTANNDPTSPDSASQAPGSTNKLNRTPKMICHIFESEEAQFIAQSIGQAFQVAYMEFLKANGIEDHSFMKEMDYQEVLNSQEIFGDELEIFAKKELQKEVVVPKAKGEILGIVIVESGWGSMLPTVVIANLASTGAAARCGQLNIGDQIIAINGLSLVGLPLSMCQTYIKNSKNQTAVKFTVVPCAPVVEVKIKRPNTKYQLGFSVQNGVICSLLRGGIAERGGVRVGHRIIEINNQSVVAVPHEKIVNLLATSVGEILMKTMPTSMFRLLTGQETPIFI